MRKIIYISAIALFNSAANAAGLYLSGGYAKTTTTKLFYTQPSAASNEYNMNIKGFPGSSEPNEEGWMADDFEAGLKEENIYNIKSGNMYTAAIGWQIPRNPLRFELEYQKSSSSIYNQTLAIHKKGGKLKQMKYVSATKPNDDPHYNPSDPTTGPATIPDPANSGWRETGVTKTVDKYEFNIEYKKPLSLNVQALILNTIFEIPGFGPVDPYIGYGIGKISVKNIADENSDSYEGSDGFIPARQIIAGVEVRVPETEWIFGIEYKDLSSTFDEHDDKIPYTYKNQSISLKVKYDFISNII